MSMQRTSAKLLRGWALGLASAFLAPLVLLTAHPGPASAGAPGGINVTEIELGNLAFVCSNDRTIQCLDRDGNFLNSPYTGVECSGTTDCDIDFIEGAEIRALLTLVADDPSPDDSSGVDLALAALLEFKLGDRSYAFANIVPNYSQDRVGEWFSFPTEDTIFNIDMGGGHIMSTAFADMNDRIVALAAAEFGITDPVVAVILEGSSESGIPRNAPRKSPELEGDESALGNSLGTIARYRVTIGFSRLAPPLAP